MTASNRHPIAASPSYLLRGFRLLFHPELRGWVFIPLVINLVVFILLAFYAIDQFGIAITWIMGFVPDWLDFLAWILWLLFGILLAVVYGYSFSLAATLLASPFYGILAEKAEIVLTGTRRDEPLTTRELIAIARRSVLRELVKLGYFLPRMVGFFLLGLLLSFIPVLNFIGPLLPFLWASWSLALQYTDYAADNNQVSFTDLRRQVSMQRGMSLGFGAIVLVATSIPILNLLTIPASVIGGSALWLERIRPSAVITH